MAQTLGFIDVIPVRSPDRIRTEIEAAKAASREADARITESSSQQAQTKAMVEVKPCRPYAFDSLLQALNLSPRCQT